MIYEQRSQAYSSRCQEIDGRLAVNTYVFKSTLIELQSPGVHRSLSLKEKENLNDLH